MDSVLQEVKAGHCGFRVRGSHLRRLMMTCKRRVKEEFHRGGVSDRTHQSHALCCPMRAGRTVVLLRRGGAPRGQNNAVTKARLQVLRWSCRAG